MEKRGEISFSSYNEYNIMEGDEQIVEHATNYYKNLFGSDDKPNFSMDQSYPRRRYLRRGVLS